MQRPAAVIDHGSLSAARVTPAAHLRLRSVHAAVFGGALPLPPCAAWRVLATRSRLHPGLAVATIEYVRQEHVVSQTTVAAAGRPATYEQVLQASLSRASCTLEQLVQRSGVAVAAATDSSSNNILRGQDILGGMQRVLLRQTQQQQQHQTEQPAGTGMVAALEDTLQQQQQVVSGPQTVAAAVLAADAAVDEVLEQWQAAAEAHSSTGFNRAAKLSIAGVADAAVVSHGGRWNNEWKNVNQDGFALCSASSTSPALLVGVFDGHGPGGEHASAAAAEVLAGTLPALHDQLAAGASSSAGGGEGACPAQQQALVQALRSVGQAMQQAEGDKYRDCGTAVAACLVEPGSITAAWLGDCRAVAGLSVETPCGPGCLVQALTSDHKPNSPQEYARIKATGKGRVVQLAPRHPYRLCGYSGANTLTLSRALGDTWALQLGLTYEPDALTLTLPLPATDSNHSSLDGAALSCCPTGTQLTHMSVSSSSSSSDEECWEPDWATAGPPRHVLVLASDGLWEVLGNAEAVDVAMSCQTAEAAAHALMHAARRRWAAMLAGRACDDITVAVAFLPA